MTITDIVVLALCTFLGWFIPTQGIKMGKLAVLNRLKIIKMTAFYLWVESDPKLLERVNPEDLHQVDFENAIRNIDTEFFDSLGTEYANHHFYAFASLVNSYNVLESQCLSKG